MALFHRFTKSWLRRISNAPPSLNAVFSTSFHGALNLHRFLVLADLLMEYFTHVALWVWIWLAPAQKFASSSNAAENCASSRSSDEMSDAADLSVAAAQDAS
jgi:hypothetical protein